MQLYRFRDEGGFRTAFTADPLGESLPRDGRVWQYLGRAQPESVDRLRADVTMDDILREVRVQGYFVWPKI